MDTATHVVMGVGLAGIAAIDPVIAHDPVTAQAVFIGVVGGSLIPDIDTVLKLRNNAVYIRNHRGITHSLPATLAWPVIISIILMIFMNQANFLHLLLWTFIGVFMHVFVDIFNAYGTQALGPLSYKWIALGVINIFDPFIFSLHIAGFILWFLFGSPAVIFISIYILLFFYYLWRIYAHHRVVKRVKAMLPDAWHVYLSPTMRWSNYHLSVKGIDFLYVGEVTGDAISIIDTFERIPVADTDIIRTAKKDKNLAAFLSFSPIYTWSVNPFEGGYEVRFTDLRYLSKDHYPFVAAVWISEEREIISSFTGWVYSEEKLRKKLIPFNGKEA